MAGSWCAAWRRKRFQKSPESKKPDSWGAVCLQKKEKLRRSWASSRMLVLIVIVRGDEELVSVEDVGERLELLFVSNGLDEPARYPSHVRPVVEHFLHAGLVLSHLIRRILRLCKL
jgi:hypothetical protein